MKQQNIEQFLAINANKLPASKMLLIRDVLSKLDDDKSLVLQTIEFKAPSVILIISILLGSLGIDRFMLGDAGLGVLKLLTCGGCYIWWIIDMINAQDRTKEYNYKQLVQVLSLQGVTGLY